VPRSFAAADFFLQGWLVTYFKVENTLAGKKIKAKPGFSLWRTAQSGCGVCCYF